MSLDYNKKLLRISVGGSNRGVVTNGEATWSKIRNNLSYPVVTEETFEQYLDMDVSSKNDLKNINGYWIGAHCRNNSRARHNLSSRDLLCFDIDNVSLYDGDLLSELCNGETLLNEYEFFIHTTRSHAPRAPRIRVVFPLVNPIEIHHYEALGRFMAFQLDPEMATVARESFYPSQMMYNPSCSIDMEEHYFTYHNKGKWLDPMPFLESMDVDDWALRANWPRQEGEELRARADKAEWPLDKKGIVGAFCNAYDIHEAIATFLPDIYEPVDYASENPRYKYLKGSGADGAIVYDDGVFLYSHHASDPAYLLNCNAYDLVRLHLFGYEDEKILAMPEQKRPPVSRWPSTKEMMKFVEDDERVDVVGARRMVPVEACFADLDELQTDVDVRNEDEYAFDQLLGDLGLEPDKETEKTDLLGRQGDDAWTEKLDLNRSKLLKNTPYNVMLISQNDKRLAGAFAFNELYQNVVVVRPVKSRIDGLRDLDLKDRVDGDKLQDRHIEWVRTFLSSPCFPKNKGYGLKVSDQDVRSQVYESAIANSYHPVRRYLNSLEWDGVNRLDTLFSRYCGCDDNQYTREAARLTLAGAVARVYEPGCKFDYAVILEGNQGVRKSTFVRALAKNPKWFTDMHTNLADKQKVVESTMGFWWVELPELSVFGQRDAREIKQFISGEEDTVRLAYRRDAMTYKRQCIFMGTVNGQQYLSDETGNRRFWPIEVKVKHIDIDALEEEIDQLYAQAVAIYKEMREAQPTGLLPLYLSQEATDIAERVQSSKLQTTRGEVAGADLSKTLNKPLPAESVVSGDLQIMPSLTEETMVIRNVISARCVWSEVYGKPVETMSRRDLWQLNEAMAAMTDWECIGRARYSKLFGNARETLYVRKGSDWKDEPYTIVETGF